jgi:hypothetical protein
MPCYHFTTWCVSYSERLLDPPKIPMSWTTVSHFWLFNTFTSNQYLCPQTSVFPHFSLHATCIRPCMHSLHVPLHRWLQLSKARHGIWQRDSSSSENGSKTRTDHKWAGKLSVVKKTILYVGNTNGARCEVLNTELLSSQLFQNVMLCHLGNNFLKYHRVFIFRLRHFFSRPLTVSILGRPESSAMKLIWDTTELLMAHSHLNSSCVTSHSVQKSFNHTMYLPEHKTRIIS